MFGQISGGFVNPTLLVASVLWQMIVLSLGFYKDDEFYEWDFRVVLAYVFGSTLGAILAGFAYLHLGGIIDSMDAKYEAELGMELVTIGSSTKFWAPKRKMKGGHVKNF